MVDRFGWVEEVVDPRPLRRLAAVSGSVLVAAVVLLVHEHRRGPRGLSGGGLFLVWLVVAIAGLLLLGAVAGLLARRAARRPRLDDTELHDRRSVLARLRRGDDLPPELTAVAQRAVDDTYGWRWAPWSFLVLGSWWTGTAFTYAGRELWIHLVVGVGYLVLSVWPLRERRRVLRAAARAGVRPRRRRGRAGRGDG